MVIGIIGAGHVGGALGRRLAAQGHDVLMAVREPESPEHEKLARTLGLPRLFSPQQAASAADVVVLATPWSVTESVVKGLTDLAGKVLIDCTNPLTKELTLSVESNSSGGELVQSWARSARVVKAFNTTGFNIMEDPTFSAGRAMMYFCGDDGPAKAVVKALVEDVGFEPVDAGPLKNSRLLEHLALLWIYSAYQFGLGRDFAFGILRKG